MRKIMVRSVAMLCTFTILFCSLPTVSKANGAELDDGEAFTRSFMQNTGLSDHGTLYIHMLDWSKATCYAYLDNLSVYTWIPGSTNAIELCRLPEPPQRAFLSFDSMNSDEWDQLKKTVSYIVAGDDALYGYNVYSGLFGKITKDGVAWGDVRLDVTCLKPDHESYPRRVARSILANGKLLLFVALGETYGDSDAEYELFSFDLETGKYTKIEAKNAVAICRYRDDQLLILQKGNDSYRLSTLQMSDSAIAELPISMAPFSDAAIIGGLAYGEEDDTICITTGSQVYRSQSGEAFVPVAFIPANALMTETPAWMLPDGRYALCLGGVYVRAMRKELNQIRLRIQAGTISPAIVESFTKKHPDILVEQIAALSTADELAQAVTTKDASVDIFQLNVDYAYHAMVQKGYAVEMNESEIICNDVAQMYPYFQSILSDPNGNIVAYPTQLYLFSNCVNIGFWKLIFGNEPLPATYDEWLDAMLRWELDDAQDYPELDYVENFDYAYLVQTLISAYVQQYASSDELLEIDTPELKRLLEKLALVYKTRIAESRNVSFVSMDEWDGKSSIFSFTQEYPLANKEMPTITIRSTFLYDINPLDITSFSMKFNDSDTQKTNATMLVYVISPQSEHIESAIKFIEEASHIENNPNVYYATHPQMNEPYQNPNFETLTKDMKKRKGELEEAIKNADGINRSDLQDTLDYVNLWLNSQENQRWLIPAASIKSYRALAETIDLHEDSLYIGASGNDIQQSIQSICTQYASGQFTIDSFLAELSSKLKLVYFEMK